MGGAASKNALSDDDIVSAAHEKDLEVYAGFKAEERRILFHHGTTHKPKQELETWLPTGLQEGATKAIQNGPDRALVTYWNEQFMEDEAYLSNRKAAWLVDDGNDSNPYVHRTALERVLPESQQTSPHPNKHALVQIWTINYNEDFKKKFKDDEKNHLLGVKTINPDEAKFQPNAVANFQRALVRLFGESALAGGLLYCTSETKNIQRVYVGTQAQFRDYFAVQGVKESFAITSVQDVSNPIPVAHRSSGDADILMVVTVETENKRGQKGSQSWTFSPQGQHVLYKRQGYTSFFCLKSKAQFDQDCELFGLVNC